VEKVIPASVSYTAGTYCCNEVFYGVSHYLRNNKPGFERFYSHPVHIRAGSRCKTTQGEHASGGHCEGLEIAVEVVAEGLEK